MTKTKMKGAVVLLLALVLALALSLSAMNFAPKSTASAATITKDAESIDFNAAGIAYTGTTSSETALSNNQFAVYKGSSGASAQISTKSGVTYLYLKLAAARFKVSNCTKIEVYYYVNATSSADLVIDYCGTEDVALTETTYKTKSATAVTSTTTSKNMTTAVYEVPANQKDGYFKIAAITNSREVYIRSITITTAAPAAKTATLDVNGGEVVDTTLTADANNEVTFPSATAPTGYSFIGWTDGKNAYKAGDKVEIVGGEIFTALYASKSYSIGGNADLSAIRFVYNVEFNAATTDQMLSLLPEFVGTFNLSAEGGKEGGYNGTIDSVKISENTIMFAIQLVDIGADNKNTDVTATVSLSINGVVLLNEFAQTTSYTIATTPVE